MSSAASRPAVRSAASATGSRPGRSGRPATERPVPGRVDPRLGLVDQAAPVAVQLDPLVVAPARPPACWPGRPPAPRRPARPGRRRPRRRPPRRPPAPGAAVCHCPATRVMSPSHQRTRSTRCEPMSPRAPVPASARRIRQAAGLPGLRWEALK